MKTLIASILIAATLSQCTTTPGGENVFDLNKTILAVDITVPIAVRLGVAKQPKVEAYLKDLTLVIDTIASGTVPSPAAFISAVSPVASTDTPPEYMAILDIVVELYKATYADAVKARLEQSETLVPFLKAVSIAIKKGLTKSLAEQYGAHSI